MPYNNNPIAPSEEVTGTTSLPLARVKKIIAADPDTGACSNNAAFAIAIASQLFVQHLVEQTHNVVKSERRPRRNIQYKDVANAVSRIDNLEFLTDIVPRTTSFGKFREKRAKEDAKNGDLTVNGQKTLEQIGKREPDDEDMEDADHDGNVVNGVVALHDEVALHSPNSSRTGIQTRHNFDAVRNGYFYDETGPPMPMEQ